MHRLNTQWTAAGYLLKRMIRSSASTSPQQVKSIVEVQMNPITETFNPNILAA
jgi:hypothetical protein